MTTHETTETTLQTWFRWALPVIEAYAKNRWDVSASTLRIVPPKSADVAGDNTGRGDGHEGRYFTVAHDGMWATFGEWDGKWVLFSD